MGLAVAALVVLPLFFALLAPPTLGGGEGASFSAASRDLSTAALDRLERLLSGELTVRLSGLEAVATHAPLLRSSASSIGYRAPLCEQRAHPSETERTL